LVTISDVNGADPANPTSQGAEDNLAHHRSVTADLPVQSQGRVVSGRRALSAGVVESGCLDFETVDLMVWKHTSTTKATYTRGVWMNVY
jgi:hypothetical protein